MNEQYSAMRSNVSMLGKLLGDTIKDALGENILDQVETIRKLSKSSRAGNDTHRKELLNTLQNLSNEELLQAHTELWDLTFGYLKSMALECAIKLGLPNAIHRCGGAATLPDLLDAVSVPESKKAHLPRLMRFLAAFGIFTVSAPAAGECADGEKASVYGLTPVSRLLADDAGANGSSGSLSPFVLSQTTKYHVKAGMGSDTQLAMDFVISNYGDVFEGVTSLVDVGGGPGSAARAIARAFPHVKCSVLVLPNVVNSVPQDGVVEYISGDMMRSIPTPDAVFLKV